MTYIETEIKGLDGTGVTALGGYEKKSKSKKKKGEKSGFNIKKTRGKKEKYED